MSSGNISGHVKSMFRIERLWPALNSNMLYPVCVDTCCPHIEEVCCAVLCVDARIKRNHKLMPPEYLIVWLVLSTVAAGVTTAADVAALPTRGARSLLALF